MRCLYGALMGGAARSDQRGGSGPGGHAVATLPNLITLVRLACVPVFVWLVVHDHKSGWVPAAILLGGLGATDWVDGYLARRLGQVSTVGKVLDPVADRVLLAVGALTVIVVGAVPLWVAVAALLREGLVAVAFLVLAVSRAPRIDVRKAGKAGTFGLMCALPLYLAGHSDAGWRSVPEALAWVAVVPGLVFGWYAAFGYIPEARRAFARRSGQ